MASPSPASTVRKTPSPALQSASIPVTRSKPNTNGLNGRFKSNESKAAKNGAAKDFHYPGKAASDRMLSLLANGVGCNATITLKNGAQFRGIFCAASVESTPMSQYVLKMCQRISSPSSGQSKGTPPEAGELIGFGGDFAMAFDFSDVIAFVLHEVVTGAVQKPSTNGTSSSFKTDSDISGNFGIRERELKPWEPATESSSDLSLIGSTKGNWNQFETNERLYGVKTDYDENIYTTSIDRSHPSYKQRAAAAEKLAREIEGSATSNPHIAEERGLAFSLDNGADEETRFSGVQRDVSQHLSTQNPNKYTPPARRAPTGSATVAGAPVDPAIISSQLARPELSTKSSNKREAAAIQKTQIATETQVKEEEKGAVDPSRSAGLVGELQGEILATGASNGVEQTLSSKPNTATASTATSTTLSTGAVNATDKIETTVHDAFKNFAAQEKMKLQERQRQTQKREKELKLADLKKFATSFKLKTAVPEDMLGILAKDKHKQVEIVEKSQRSLKEHVATPAMTSSHSETSRSGISSRPDQDRIPTSAVAQQTPRTDRGPTAPVAQAAAASPRSGLGNLGQRLLSQPQYRDKTSNPSPLPFPDLRTQPNTPSGPGLDHPSARHGSIPIHTPAGLRFNAQAMEFRPNPSANAFSPAGSRQGSLVSPGGIQAATHSLPPLGRAKFFSDDKARTTGSKLSIKSAFNPITRMKAEVAADEKKAKEFAVNNGIPQAYRTPPTWETSAENMDKTYLDMYEKTPITTQRVSASNVMPHQYQLPPHLQPGSQALPSPTLHGPTSFQHAQPHFGYGRDQQQQQNDDHRIHISTSNSSAYPSPRFQPPMVAYQQPMISPMQPAFSQSVAIGMNGQPIAQLRGFPGPQQYVNVQNAHLAAPMLVNHSNNGTIMGVSPIPQMAAYIPAPGHMFAMHAGVSQTSSGPGGFGAPRHTQPMMQQSSQQGHAMPYMYVAQGQNGTMFAQPAMPMIPMRPGGIPMQQQPSFGASAHVGFQFPTSHRGPSFGGTNHAGHQHGNHPHPLPQHTPHGTHVAAQRTDQEDGK